MKTYTQISPEGATKAAPALNESENRHSLPCRAQFTSLLRPAFLAAVLLATVFCRPALLWAQGTAFTYQG